MFPCLHARITSSNVMLASSELLKFWIMSELTILVTCFPNTLWSGQAGRIGSEEFQSGTGRVDMMADENSDMLSKAPFTVDGILSPLHLVTELIGRLEVGMVWRNFCHATVRDLSSIEAQRCSHCWLECWLEADSHLALAWAKAEAAVMRRELRTLESLPV